MKTLHIICPQRLELELLLWAMATEAVLSLRKVQFKLSYDLIVDNMPGPTAY
jgi:hypothetical protein